MKLFNLTFDKIQYVSSISPEFLPDDNYSFIEIEYNDEIVTSIKGTYIYDSIKKECILSDIDISLYLMKLLKVKEISYDLEFIKDPECPKYTKITKIFILSLCSYLVYFDFKEIPFELSLEILDNNMFKYFLSYELNSNNNDVELSWNEQVKQFSNSFTTVFPIIFDFETTMIEKDDVESLEIKEDIIIQNKVVEEEQEDIIEKQEIESKEQEIEQKEHIKLLIKKYVKKYVDVYFDKKSQELFEKLNKEADEISKEMKEFKKRLFKDLKDVKDTKK